MRRRYSARFDGSVRRAALLIVTRSYSNRPIGKFGRGLAIVALLTALAMLAVSVLF